MAGITHSAFRRLLADFGGYGALTTEMLSAPALLRENLDASPFTKRRSAEGPVFYQLGLIDLENIGPALERLATINPFAIDINMGCPAPEIKKRGGGSELFEDLDRMRRVLAAVRSAWTGPLTVKCRLGRNTPGWQQRFTERMDAIREAGVDAIVVHPRFSDEKLTRTARHALFPWIAGQARLPLIGNGDLSSASAVRSLLDDGSCAGCMIGRMAAVKPWFFREISDGGVPAVDYREVWNRFYGYVLEDFPPEKAFGRLKQFTASFACNFFFGHELYRLAQGSTDGATLRKRVDAFLAASPALVAEPSVTGV
jgi:tRNA-dihydrouridine synthase